MTTLDASLRLRLINELSRPAQVAKGDIEALKASAKGLDGVSGGEKLAADLKRADVAADEAKRSVQEIRGEARQLGATQGGTELAADLRRAADAAGTAGQAVRAVRGEAGQLGQTDGGAELAADLNRATQAAEKTERQVKDLRDETRQLGRADGGEELAADLKRAGEAAGKTRRQIKDVRDAAQQLGGASGGERLAGDLNRAGAAADRLEKELQDVIRAAYQLDRVKPLDRMARGMSDAGRAADRTRRSVDDVRRSTEALPREAGRPIRQGMQEVEGAARKAKNELAGVKREAESARTSISGLYRQRLAAIGGGRGEAGPGLNAMLPIGAIAPWLGGAAVAGAGMKTFGASISIEKSLAEVRKFYDLNDAELVKMKAEIFDMVGELGKAPEAIAAVYARAGQQGVPRDQVREYARDVAKIAVAWNMGEEAAANGLGTIKSSLNLNQAELVKIAGTINTLADGMEGPVAESDLLEYLSRVAGTAKALGGTAKAALAMGAALRSAGDQPEIAATTFNTILTKLASADRGSKDALAGYKELGFDPDTLAKDMQKNADTAMKAFFERIRDLQTKGTNVIGPIADIFGTEYSDNILKFVNVLGIYEKALKMVADDAASVGTLDRSYQIQSSTTAAQVDRFKANLKLTADAMAADYLPAVNAGLERMNAQLARIREQGSAFDQLRAGAEGFAKGLGYDDAGKMLADLERRVTDLAGPKTTPAFRNAFLFEEARQSAAAFRADLEYIRDLYDSVFGAKEEKTVARERLNRQFDETTVRMQREADRRGQFSPEAFVRRKAIGDERYDAAADRIDSAARAAEPPRAKSASPEERRSAVDQLREQLAARAGRMAAAATPPAAPEKRDWTIEGRIQGAFAPPAPATTPKPSEPPASAQQTEPSPQTSTAPRPSAPTTSPAERSEPAPRISAAPTSGERPAVAPVKPTAPEPIKVPVTPELKIDPTIQGKVEGAFTIPLEGAARDSMQSYAAALEAGGAQAVTISQQIAARIKAALDITATPTITPRFSAAAGAGASGGAPAAAPAGGGATPGKQSRLERPGGEKLAGLGDVHVTQHIYGSRDPAATARAAQRRQNQAVREARSRALHDLGSPTA